MSWNVALPADTSKIRLSAGYIRNNETAIQSVISASSLAGPFPYLPNTVPVFLYADTAPSGWTLYSSVSDCLLAIKGGSSQYNTTGGTGATAGTWNGPGYTLLRSDVRGSGSSGGPYCDISSTGPVNPPNAHSHNWTTTRPVAAVGIFCTKNS